MQPMSDRLRAVTTGVASCVLLAPLGCRRPSADVAVAPHDGTRTADGDAGERCDDKPARRKAPPPGSPDDQDPPTVLGGRFIARDRVQLTFSEPLAPVEQVNPRQFRLSTAYSRIDDQGGYASGYYYDLGGTDSYEPPLVVVSLEVYAERPEVLGLQLNRPIPVERCVQIRDTRKALADEAASGGGPMPRTQLGVFLHYTARGSIGIRDTANNPMAEVGGAWALHFGARNQSMYGTEPIMRLDLLVELDCPGEEMGVAGPPGPI